MRSFVPGIELARAFYEEAVARLVGGVPHAAAFLGMGSDVLGFDTERSTDHDWGPRLLVFPDDEDAERLAAALSAAITDPLVGRLPPAGSADQVIDSTPALGDLRYPKAVTSVPNSISLARSGLMLESPAHAPFPGAAGEQVKLTPMPGFPCMFVLTCSAVKRAP